MEIIYLNGKLTGPVKDGINPSDQGFLSGAGLFETMRAYSGCIFLLENHLRRLTSSASAFGLETLDAIQLADTCRSVVAANRLESARVRLTVSFEPTALASSTKITTILVQALPYAPPPPVKYLEGYRAVISPVRRFSRSLLACHKTTSRLDCLIARNQARDMGFDEALFLNEKDRLTEGSVTNLFLIGTNGTLLTPPLSEGLLPGITRQLVLGLAAELGIDVVEKCVSLEDLETSGEAFITNSLLEVMPLASITNDDHEYIFSRGMDTETLIKAYRKAVEQTTNQN